MLPRTRLACVLVMAIACSAAVFSQADKSTETKAFAERIYRLWDDGKYAEMYRYFHSTMKAQATEEQWVAMAKSVAQKTGKNLERRFKETQPVWGQQMLRYDSRYETGRANDDIYIIEEDGRLTVSGIFVRPTL